ncbi:oligopeptidase A [Thiogranum longum]|uniref:oligopeptidase A n=1 Tax=Thiogranum longum TaxID=1537524 RepID=A0A4V2PGH3_9GAMM|nr:oligopeptidase A [Thiogranum longum]TCK16806.1 oligopeptidase A [Thiogranum longum]
MNPLLELTELPAFDRIRPEHVEPAVDQALADVRTEIENLLQAGPPWNWDNTLAPLELALNRLHRVWSPVSHLNAVMNSDALRAAYNACLPKLSALETELGQHKGLYRAVNAIANSNEFDALDPARQQSIRHRLRDFRLMGIALGEDEQARFKEIQQRLSELQARFQENLLDATHGWKKIITDESLLSGLPESALELARQHAENENTQGWLFTLDFPSYFPVVAYADNRALREELYTAYMTRASDTGPHAGQWDNTALMDEILMLRDESARLLGFASYAEYSLATKMADSPTQVLQFLNELAEHSHASAHNEMNILREFAREQGADYTLQAWDVPYWSEKLRRQQHDLSQEMLKPWFPHTRVIKGLFDVVEQLYGLRITERDGVPVWHTDVRFFDIHDTDGTLRGSFYLDLYARANKRGGAWMDDCASRLMIGNQQQTPVAYLTCNFSPPVGDRPALLTHDEVTTLFHEFGHGLHHMLTRVDYPSVSGINGVAWDAVELPSQFMENWCWEREPVNLISSHVETGEPLPDDLFERLRGARNFQSAMQMVRQLEFALFDMRIHDEYQSDKGARIYEMLDQVRTQVAVVPVPEFNRFAHGFSHIFGGGYAAGYYSYKWAEVLSADAYSLFEETGVFNRESGRRFLENILEQGGSANPMQLYRQFRGREPDIRALLRHSGLEQ